MNEENATAAPVGTSDKPLKKYKSVRSYTELLMKPLSVEDHLAQPCVDVSPPKWHLGHTTWFYEAMILERFVGDYQIFDKHFAFYFNSYYEALGDKLERDQRGHLTRPSLDKVYQYRQHVDQAMQQLLQEEVSPEILNLLHLGLNHEQQHQELFLTDFKYILSSQPFHPVYDAGFEEGKAEDSDEWLSPPEGIHEIGFEGEEFAYDNETSRHKVYLHPYNISKKLVTNGEWLEFINDGGYQNFEHWHSDGWAWVQEEKVVAPLYWEQINGKWHRFTLGGLTKVETDLPVAHISYYEAVAYANWKGQRLPTEAEWEAAADSFEWGQRWEWTNSAYLPYPNYKQYNGPAKEYNGKFMVNQMVLRGASVATSPGHSRKTYRNFFHAPLRWQFTGLRLAQ